MTYVTEIGHTCVPFFLYFIHERIRGVKCHCLASQSLFGIIATGRKLGDLEYAFCFFEISHGEFLQKLHKQEEDVLCDEAVTLAMLK